ncbi:hypothetical protein MPTK1_6g02470 [Marchantia polymorpha subsp. ruderalis]|uniref:Uncharacterized protein n=2 Tax=Marchantia polymorpha TaxID=3197 RepID=A0AAF6BMR9_MARPO|nr:hypothetical protein MARPO_0035s0032 [Marchantia polymorpha]BBN13303.1 hypothetical protein Mp_6g02470 [Marchantia polymorpha subsp. ruderalis]|eukprot:PTQ41229.1 hypothetical protein MARPO_0035s0032 [Marchantia polymorpha]
MGWTVPEKFDHEFEITGNRTVISSSLFWKTSKTTTSFKFAEDGHVVGHGHLVICFPIVDHHYTFSSFAANIRKPTHKLQNAHCRVAGNL